MKNRQLKAKHLIFTPSWLSGLVVGLVWLATVVGGLASTHFRGSSWQLGLFNLGSSSSGTYKQIAAHVQDNRLIGNAPLFIFWLGMGFVVYYLAIAIYDAFHNAVEIRAELTYVNSQRRHLLQAAFEQLIVRLAALVAWFLYIAVFFKHLLPWVLSTLRSASVAQTGHTVGQAIWAAVVLLVALHAHTVLLRLVVLKTRVFSSAVL